MASRRNDGGAAEHHRLPGSGREAGAAGIPPEQSKLIVRAFADAVNARNWARVTELLAPDFRRHSNAAGGPAVRSADELVAFLKAECIAFPDAREAILDLVAEADKVAARHSFRGTQSGPMGNLPPSGRVLESTYLAIYRIEGRRIAEAWAEWDNLSGLRQLGHADGVR